MRLAEHDGDLLHWFYDHGFTPGAKVQRRATEAPGTPRGRGRRLRRHDRGEPGAGALRATRRVTKRCHGETPSVLSGAPARIISWTEDDLASHVQFAVGLTTATGVARNLKIAKAKLDSAYRAARKADLLVKLDQAVQNNRITADQAAQLKAKLDEADLPGYKPLLFGGGAGLHGGMFGVRLGRLFGAPLFGGPSTGGARSNPPGASTAQRVLSPASSQRSTGRSSVVRRRTDHHGVALTAHRDGPACGAGASPTRMRARRDRRQREARPPCRPAPT